MSDSFNWDVQFGKPLEISSEIDDHSIFVLQSASLATGSNKATLTLTVRGQKFVIANLSARKCTAKLNLLLTNDDDEMVLSCNQGSRVIVSGIVQSKGCCDHEHGDEDEISEDGAIEEVAVQKSYSNKQTTEETQDKCDEIDEEDDDDDEDEDEDEDDDEEEEEEEDDDDDDDGDDDDDDDDVEEEEEEAVDKTPPGKKVTFNPKEQGPHKSPSPTQPNPLKPAIKQAETKPVAVPQQAPSRIGQTFSIQGGLKYTVLKEGKGPVAIYGKRVNVKYVGCLASNGKRFDKGQIRFRLGGGEVIEGWDKGVKDMRVGESRRLLIPPHLGYGKRGAPPAIPPNATLAFEVELLDLM
jgi:FK506-binding nuclear protein